jgi:hypothetical protein
MLMCLFQRVAVMRSFTNSAHMLVSLCQGKKDFKLLSFGEEAEEEEQATATSGHSHTSLRRCWH